MSQQEPPAAPEDTPHGDPWQAFSQIVAGVLLYGGAGWLADRWLGTSYLVAIGIVIGAGLSLYAVVKQFGHVPPSSPEK
ncbi:AtpZ/AtpI family protein [Nocardioides sp. IC4_145]|uniref:AtpZ/AtpI family protein n=1 Tax=Nocardioides sp. IC4_145 TaxID=2714037 RepID=UPI00140D2D8A|nr:AtpZ/AtpI family protein [Nocardioides sp. IC4_145]NHC23270.1 AtpZ/AtpI family protein [Nocardioides sp. IC4_145]